MGGGDGMGFFDAIMGRSKPVQPNLDALFRLPTATLTLQAELGITPTGLGSVSFRAPAGMAFNEVQADIEALVSAPSPDGAPGPKVDVEVDGFGFTWLVLHHDPGDVPGLCTDLHAANATLKDSGFGSTLLCSLINLATPDGRPVALVYLFKQGTFYPFAPIPGQQRRDNMLEIQVRDLVAGDLPMEPSLNRWFAVWGAPGM